MGARVVIQNPELTWKGEWNASTTYPSESVVGYQGSSYVANDVTQGDVPTDGSPWDLLALRGEQGPMGPEGPSGDPGPAGNAVTYIWTQSLPSETWVIPHGHNRYPAVSVVDSAGTVVIGEVRYIDANTIEIAFIHPFSGRAFLN